MAARVALVAALGLAVVGTGPGSGRTTRSGAAVLGPGFIIAYPSIAADGTVGFDALWTGDAIMTSHCSRATRTWGTTLALSPTGVGQSIGRIAASPSGAAAAIWAIDEGGASHMIQGSVRDSASGVWQPAVAI